ncbi:MAG: Microsomal dipeptidase [Acidimicrobiia bacterium]|nr:Microsomal dipeptidase [Acidimicrobiia bacterium]
MPDQARTAPAMPSDVIDLHVESFIWSRLFGYRLDRHHQRTALGGRLYGQADVPRMTAAGVTGAVMSIATNPFRTATGRRRITFANVARLQSLLTRAGATVVADLAGYRQARQRGELACFVGLQGGHALAPEDLSHPALRPISRITLMHLTNSALGCTSSPVGRDRGLSADGASLIEAMRAAAVLLDLAHSSRRTFWDAVAVHGRTPLIVSHTGVNGVHRSWRNLDDDQIRAVADRGGVVGVMVHRGFLASPSRRARSIDVARHIAHIVAVGGIECAALGTDYDGFIVPPPDLRTVSQLPNLVAALARVGLSDTEVEMVMGTNALRVIGAVRPGQV